MITTEMLKHAVPDSILTVIGDMTVSFAMLENSLQMFADLLIGTTYDTNQSRIGALVTAEMSFKNIRALVISLYLQRFGESDPDLPTMRTMLKTAAAVEELRNRITHSIWAHGSTPDRVQRLKITAKEKRGLAFAVEEIGAEDIRRIVDDIQTLSADLQRFWAYIQKAKWPIPQQVHF